MEPVVWLFLAVYILVNVVAVSLVCYMVHKRRCGSIVRAADYTEPE